jgi:hypothetical protein
MGWVVNATPRLLYPRGKSRYPLYRRLGGPQGRSARVRTSMGLNLAPTNWVSVSSGLIKCKLTLILLFLIWRRVFWYKVYFGGLYCNIEGPKNRVNNFVRNRDPTYQTSRRHIPKDNDIYQHWELPNSHFAEDHLLNTEKSNFLLALPIARRSSGTHLEGDEGHQDCAKEFHRHSDQFLWEWQENSPWVPRVTSYIDG